MKIKLLSLLMAICMVISLFPAAVAVEPAKAPATQEHIHETEPVLPQAEKAPEIEPEATPVLPTDTRIILP